MKRRAFLATGAGVAIAGCSFGGGDDSTDGDSSGERDGPDISGREELPSVDTPSREPTTDRQDSTAVHSMTSLSEELAAATAGDVISVPPDVEIDLSGQWNVSVPSGVTLDGGRGDQTDGALLWSPESDRTPEDNTFLRKIELEQGARLTGFRIQSTFDEYVNAAEEHDSDFYAHRGGGGVTAGKDCEVDNCEISGWPYAAVFARGNAYIHDNYIHHNTWEGLGYGVAIPEGNHLPVIESNRFNYNRHSITGAGGPKVGFVARYNLVEEEWVGSQFDMHGTEGMEGIAGEKMVIYRNTFQGTHAVEEKSRDPGGAYPAIDIRGTPTDGVYVEQNWFYHDDREGALRHTESSDNVYFVNNHFGRTTPGQSNIGAPGTIPLFDLGIAGPNNTLLAPWTMD